MHIPWSKTDNLPTNLEHSQVSPTYCPRVHSLFQFKLKLQKKDARRTRIHTNTHKHTHIKYTEVSASRRSRSLLSSYLLLFGRSRRSLASQGEAPERFWFCFCRAQHRCLPLSAFGSYGQLSGRGTQVCATVDGEVLLEKSWRFASWPGSSYTPCIRSPWLILSDRKYITIAW